MSNIVTQEIVLNAVQKMQIIPQTIWDTLTRNQQYILYRGGLLDLECDNGKDHFSGYSSMKMDMTRIDGDCEEMIHKKTGIEFIWCPGYHQLFYVYKDRAFQKKGEELGLRPNMSDGVIVRPNRIEKDLLLELCKSEGMDPGALSCLNFLLEKRWLSEVNKNNKRKSSIGNLVVTWQ